MTDNKSPAPTASNCKHRREVDEPNGSTVCADCDENIRRWADGPAPKSAEIAQVDGVTEDDCPYCGGTDEVEARLSDGKTDYIPCPHPCHRLAHTDQSARLAALEEAAKAIQAKRGGAGSEFDVGLDCGLENAIAIIRALTGKDGQS